MRTICEDVFKFDELNDEAKEKARDWFRDGGLNYDWWDQVYEDAEQIAPILGVTFAQKAVQTVGGKTWYESEILFSGFSSQGDGASFGGSYQHAEGSTKKIREFAPIDEKLHAIADGLAEAQQKNGNSLTAKVTPSGRYCHSRSNNIDVFIGEDQADYDSETTKEVSELLRDFMDWIYEQLRKEWDFRNSDEAVDEDIMANDYEFYANGSRARGT